MSAQINYRAIIRISYNGESNATSTVRNNVTALLKEAGLEKKEGTTGGYETKSSNIVQVQKQLNSALEVLAGISADEGHPTTLDHIWIYIDQAG